MMKKTLPIMKKVLKTLGMAIVLLFILFHAFIFLRDNIGVTAGNLEKDARISQGVDDSWLVTMETTDKMSVMLFYPPVFDPEHPDRNVFSVYENRPGLSFGYHFISGGSAPPDSVHQVGVRGNEYAFYSMNRQQASFVETDDGNHKTKREIDSQKPFAFILPMGNIESVVFLDVDGNVPESGLSAGEYDIQMEAPIVMSKNNITLADGQTAFVNIEMLSGRYFYEENPGPFQGYNWNGNFQIRVYTDEGDLNSTLSVTPVLPYEYENQEYGDLTFQGDFSLIFDDYNNDGNPDFTLGQYLSSNGYDYAIYSIKPKGEVVKLDTGGPMFISGDGGYSIQLDKQSPTSFKNTYYDNSVGEIQQVIYQWKENQFVADVNIAVSDESLPGRQTPIDDQTLPYLNEKYGLDEPVRDDQQVDQIRRLLQGDMGVSFK
jgi:hypothetical protein